MPTINSKNLLKLGNIVIDAEEIRDEIKRDLMFELDKRFNPIRYSLCYILDVIFELHPTRYITDKGEHDALSPEEKEKYIKKVQKEVFKLREITDSLEDTPQIGHCGCCKCQKYARLRRIAQEVIV